jgi:UDP-glucose 4-epimerase
VLNARDRVVVTGGAGFVGSHLVDELLSGDGADVTVVDNLARGRLENLARWQGDPRLKIVQADVRNLDDVRRALRGSRLVYHLAAHAAVVGARADPDEMFATNVIGTHNVLRAAAEHGVRRVVFTSSGDVYGEPVCLPVDESHPLLAINAYGASKVAGEALCRAFAHENGIETAVLRLANVYGDRDFDRVIPTWIAQARTGEDLLVYGGEQIVDFVWVGDVTRAIIRAAESDLPLPPINVAGGTGTKVRDLARRIVGLSGSAAHIRTEPQRPNEVSRFVGETDRMTQLLGVTPATDPLSHLATMMLSLASTAA